MRNTEKVKQLGIEKDIRFYYDRENYTKPTTICLIKVGDRYFKGIGLCNSKDQFIKRVGRAIALGRAIRALETDTYQTVTHMGEEVLVSLCDENILDFEEHLFSYKAKES